MKRPQGSGDFGLDEEAERQWRDYLPDFKRDVWEPLFKPYGVTLGEALIVWKLNTMNNNVIDVENAIRRDEG